MLLDLHEKLEKISWVGHGCSWSFHHPFSDARANADFAAGEVSRAKEVRVEPGGSRFSPRLAAIPFFGMAAMVEYFSSKSRVHPDFDMRS